MYPCSQPSPELPMFRPRTPFRSSQAAIADDYPKDLSQAYATSKSKLPDLLNSDATRHTVRHKPVIIPVTSLIPQPLPTSDPYAFPCFLHKLLPFSSRANTVHTEPRNLLDFPATSPLPRSHIRNAAVGAPGNDDDLIRDEDYVSPPPSPNPGSRPGIVNTGQHGSGRFRNTYPPCPTCLSHRPTPGHSRSILRGRQCSSLRTPAFEAQRPPAFESQVRGAGVETQTQGRQTNIDTQGVAASERMGKEDVVREANRPTLFSASEHLARHIRKHTGEPLEVVIEMKSYGTEDGGQRQRNVKRTEGSRDQRFVSENAATSLIMCCKVLRRSSTRNPP
ncbi:hypothetical protein CY34DRAFT_18119 [Suillus luteus UH-Slu-Lm8-n1]|uniref:Uncharacterized protein n=1 Tax=Suillus luteus UH-Slu-Lm8-n1 TaxID=930992 RepID=A0A0D0A6P1_9AGAM|nr:hypothetical protein CY34DRAFT_18119 [Suillus luteus UH-Slu-Lm8-n1]